jgi:hypothetical protein
MLTFDKKQITGQIELLPKRLRLAFAAACAQRQYPNYIRTSAANPIGNPEAVTRIFRELWGSIEQNVFEPGELRRDRDLCDALTPGRDTEWFSGSGFAQRALLSLAYALDTALSGRSEDAMWAAYCACEALEKYITERFAVDDASIDSVPIMQAELSRQQTDLMELRAASKTPSNEVAVVARIKRRAESDASSFLG